LNVFIHYWNVNKIANLHLPRIKADPNSLRQVFINFIENAIQAMPKGGILEIKAREETLLEFFYP